VSVRERCICKAANDVDHTNDISTVANAADALFSGAPLGGGVNHGNPRKNDYLMQLQKDKSEIHHEAVTVSGSRHITL